MVRKVYRSPWPDIELPNVDLLTHVLSNPCKAPSDTALYVDAVSGTTRTLSDVRKRSRALAHGLRNKIGVQLEEVVAFFSPNTIDYAITCYGVWGSGAIVSPVASAASATELRAQLQTSGAKYLIVHSSLLVTARAATASGITDVRFIIQADGPESGESADQLATAEQLASADPGDTQLIAVPGNAVKNRLALLCFSSGTTGVPKGVMSTHYNLVANMEQWKASGPSVGQPGETLISFVPFNHQYGLSVFVLLAAHLGVTTVVMPPGAFNLDLYLTLVQRWRSKQLIVVPPVLLLLAKDPRVEKFKLGSVQRTLNAAAPMTDGLRKAVEGRFKNLYGTEVHCYSLWGMTETNPLGSSVPLERTDKKHTVGIPVPNMEIRLVDPDTMKDVDTDPNGDGMTLPGELWCRAPNVTVGYFRNKEATRSGFIDDEEGGERWFRTGDVVQLDKDGYILIVDRIKEMIKYKGFQVTPSELEDKLLGHPDVADACVVGVWSEEQATELPVGVVVLKSTSRPTTNGHDAATRRSINNWINRQVAGYKRLRGGVHFVETIPKSPSGKMLRKQVKEMVNTMVSGKAKL